LGRWALCTLATGVVSLVLVSGVRTAPATRHVVVTVTPRVVVPYLWASVGVEGVGDATGVDVRLLGASNIYGAIAPWISLHRRRGSWRARLPQPVLPGIYPIKIRTHPAMTVARARVVYLRVYEAGTTARPLFTTSQQVAAWWVTSVAGGTVVAIRRWPGTAFDHRLTKLNQLFVIAYSPRGTSAAGDRRGVWITAVREGYLGKWRLLEVSIRPP
jgi:hypothetical protein